MYSSFTSQNQYLSSKSSTRLFSLLDVNPAIISHSNYLKANLRNLNLSLSSPYKTKSLHNDVQNANVDEFLQRLNFIDENSGTVKSLLKNHPIFESYGSTAKKVGRSLYGEDSLEISPTKSNWFQFLASRLNVFKNLKERRSLVSFNGQIRIPLNNLDEDAEKTQKSSELKNWINSFGAGFWAGTVARTSTAPLDRLKFIYQLRYKGMDKPPGLLSGLKQVYIQDGFRGMFRGNLVCCLKASPETSIRLTLFEKLKSMIKDEKTGTLSKGKLFMAGGFSGLIANAAIFPMDVLRTRLAAAPTGLYNGIFDAIRKIARTEGAIRPFYRGIHAAMIANLPTSGLNLMLYETLKEEVIMKKSLENPPTVLYMALAGASAFVTCSVVYPLQFVTSRLIMADKGNQKSMLQQIRSIYATEGARGFYKGYCPCTTKVILGSAASFGCFEVLKRTLGVEFKKH